MDNITKKVSILSLKKNMTKRLWLWEKSFFFCYKTFNGSDSLICEYYLFALKLP